MSYIHTVKTIRKEKATGLLYVKEGDTYFVKRFNRGRGEDQFRRIDKALVPVELVVNSHCNNLFVYDGGY